jgi:hypothetical protein
MARFTPVYCRFKCLQRQIGIQGSGDGITDGNSPLLLGYGKAPVVVIMPMKVDWGDKTAAEEPAPGADETEDVEEPVDGPEDIDELEDIVEPAENEDLPDEKPKKRTRRRKEKAL